MIWLDKYERRARLAPGLIALFPIAVTVLALGFAHAPILSGAVSLLSLVGLPVLLANAVRRAGQQLQEKLWLKWRGAPTTKALRLREPVNNEIQRDRWRADVEKVTGITLASRRAESANAASADEKIEVAVGRLRGLTRDEQRFPLIYIENRDYGFWRNLYGIRRSGCILSVLCVAVLGSFITLHFAFHRTDPMIYVNAIGLAVNLVIVSCWFFYPFEKSVRGAAEKYSYELLQGASSLAA